jgi:sulfur oxidation c-type cytochrome SoxX
MKDLWGNLLLGLSLLIALGVLGFELTKFTNTFNSESARSSIAHPKPEDPNKHLTPIERGRLVFEQSGCQACHNARLEKARPAAGGAVGPSLSNVGVRRKDAEWLRKQITTPQSVVPGTLMPSFASLSKEEVDALIAYLGAMDQTHDPASEPTIRPAASLVNEAGEAGAKTLIEKGQQLFLSNGCIGCHIVGKQGGPIGPNLTHEALRGRSDEWQLAHLKDPLSVYVLGSTENIAWPMPKFGQLSEEDLKALVAYLQSLH